MKEFNSGFLFTTENAVYATVDYSSVEIPIKYRVPEVGKAFNQGSENSCVSCALTEAMHYRSAIKGTKYDKPYNYIFTQRANKNNTDGMTFKEGFEILCNDGYIKSYARVMDLKIRESIYLNGSCVIGLPVFDTNRYEFWCKNGETPIGYHAVACVGYDEKGFYLKNSWGSSSLVLYPYKSTDPEPLAVEIWTILN